MRTSKIPWDELTLPLSPLEVLAIQGVPGAYIASKISDADVRALEKRDQWRARARATCGWWDEPIQAYAKAWADDAIRAIKETCAATRVHFLPGPLPFTQRVAIDLIYLREHRNAIQKDASVYLTEQAYEYACRGGQLPIYHKLDKERFWAFAAALVDRLGEDHVEAKDPEGPIVIG